MRQQVTNLSSVLVALLHPVASWQAYLGHDDRAQQQQLSASSLESNGATLECSASAFHSYLPSGANIVSASTALANTTLSQQSGQFNPERQPSPVLLDDVCVLQVRVPSSETTDYQFGLILPSKWNQRFLAVGNGGFNGGINWNQMIPNTGYGFAIVSTDTGHGSGWDALWAYNNPEAVTDWGHRALHGSVELGKELTAAYYGQTPSYSYYSGCSTGGRQGLREVQLYPEDFDGVVAGAPAWWTARLQTWTLKLSSYNLPKDAPHHIPASLFPVIGDEVVRQCDGADGVHDSIISAPHACDFQAEALLCPAGVSDPLEAKCLTIPQLDTLHNIYSDYVDVNQTFVFPGINLGGESLWHVLLDGMSPLGEQYVQYFLGLGPDWKWEDFDYSIVELADRLDPGNASATDYDLSAFHQRGGKLLMYHGMADSMIPADSSRYFYRQVYRKMMPKGVKLDDFFRFFEIPGMLHCANTPKTQNAPWYIAAAGQSLALGPSVHSTPGFCGSAKHDALLATMAWVEKGEAPDSLIATKWRDGAAGVRLDAVERQRPLCRWPGKAVWDGVGGVDLAASWKCVEGAF